MTPYELIAWRKRNGFSQAMLAKALGVHVMTISKWERDINGKRGIPPFLHLALKALEGEGCDKKTRENEKEKEER
jgi:transcriptional regulator with XRE-family HTH domain